MSVSCLCASWKSLPSLEELVIRCGEQGVLGNLELPSLLRFTRVSGGLSAEELETIARAKWPRLEHLELWTGQEAYGAGATVDNLRPFFEGAQTPALTSFGLVNCEVVHECLGALASSPMVRRLKRLDLSRGVLQDEDVDEFLRLAPAFRHLEVLDLTQNQLEEGGPLIQAALPQARVNDQREADEGTRYTALGE